MREIHTCGLTKGKIALVAMPRRGALLYKSGMSCFAPEIGGEKGKAFRLFELVGVLVGAAAFAARGEIVDFGCQHRRRLPLKQILGDSLELPVFRGIWQ